MTRLAVTSGLTRATTARTRRQRRRAQQLTVTATASVAKRLALAHLIEAQVDAGKFADYAAFARAHGLTRARVAQIVGLLHLAPDIQEDVLGLKFPAGREPISERHLRRVFAHPLWDDQRKEWQQIMKDAEAKTAEQLRRAETGR